MSIAAAKSFTFNSQSFAADGFNVYVLNTTEPDSLPDLAQPRVNIQNLAGADGAVTQGATRQPLRIRLKCATVVRDTATLEEQITNIKTALDVVGEKSFTPGWRSITKTVRQTNGLSFRRERDGAFFTLEFVEPDPS